MEAACLLMILEWQPKNTKPMCGCTSVSKQTREMCELCHAAVHFSGDTTNLQTHLVRRHVDTIALLV